MPHYDATSLPRLMQCAASKSMPVFHPTTGIDDTTSRDEGNAAHWLAQQPDIIQWADRKAPNGVYITEEMIEHVAYYLDQVRTRPTERRHVEYDMTWKVWPHDLSIGCRPDLISDDLRDYNRRIYIDDFKYGHRVVEPEMNWTLIAHACAWISDKVVPPDTYFEFRIHQPRAYHPSGERSRPWIIDAAHLTKLRSQLTEALTNNANTLTTGPYCYRCPALTNCPAARNLSMELADLVEQPIPDYMTYDEMSLMFDRLERTEETFKQYKHAMQERMIDALMRGNSILNRRMVPTEGALDWQDDITPDVLRLLARGKPVSKEKPITPKQAMKFIPEAVVMSLTKKKPGGLVMQRFDSQKLAAKLFGKGVK